MEQNKVTRKSYEKLLAEREDLMTNGRAQYQEHLRIAKGFGDLSENAEYDAAKEEQEKVETRISELDMLIENALIIDEESMQKDVANINSHIKVKDMTFKEEREFQLVDNTQSDPLNGKISADSPMGRAIEGHKVGETVEYEIPSGKKVKMKILAIEQGTD